MTATYQLFPALDAATEAALRASIERWGVIVPVLTDQHGNIIDGHHRARIATELGRPYRTVARTVGDEDEARDLATTLNTDRRHLDPEQRRQIVADLRRGGHSYPAIAGALGISQSTAHADVQKAKAEPFDAERFEEPEVIRGLDGKDRPSTRRAAAPAPEPQPTLDQPDSGPAEDLPEPTTEHTPAPETAQEVEPRPEPEPWQPAKPDLGDGISHPARYSAELIHLFRDLLAEYGVPGDNILDPFAGTGRVHELQADGWETVGIEIEPEWAALHPDTQIGDALDLPFAAEEFGAIVTSPTYGNRLADSHNASDPERRRSYTHDLGRKLDPDNSGDLHWRTSRVGDEGHGSGQYRAFHESAWAEAIRVLAPGGLFILNCCDHVRDGLVQPVTAWHCWALGQLGLVYVESRSVATRKLRQGANGELREQEQVHVFRKVDGLPPIGSR